MSGDEEIWNEPGEVRQYIALLTEVSGGSNLGTESVDAVTDAEAISKARQWAIAECQTNRIGKALLIVTGGAINGSHSETIERKLG